MRDIEPPTVGAPASAAAPPASSIAGSSGAPPTDVTALLNGLLALTHDAELAYGRALALLADDRLREHSRSFLDDHERRRDELSRLVRAKGGVPVATAQLPQGPFGAAVEALGDAATDTDVLVACKAAERSLRDRYRTTLLGEGFAADVAAVLRRGANDAAVHYAWTLEALDDAATGLPPAPKLFGRLSGAIGASNARVSDAIAELGEHAAVVAERARREAQWQVTKRPLQSAAIALGVGVAAAVLARRNPRST